MSTGEHWKFSVALITQINSEMDVPSTSTGAGHKKQEKGMKTHQPPPIASKNAWRPDPFYWPKLTNAERKKFEHVLHLHKINNSDNANTDWLDKDVDNNLESIHTRPTSRNAFIYGMSECCNTVHKGMCWAVIVEAQVTPRSLILPIVEECVINNIPMVCLNDLRNISASNFGIYTGCLGIKKGCLPELRQEILSISNNYKAAQLKLKHSQPAPMPENKEPGQNVVEDLFDLNPVDNSHNGKKRCRENDDPPATVGVPANKAHCSHTVTSASRDVVPPLNTFRMVLKKTSRNPREKAWLDIDKKQIVVISE